MKEYFRYFKWLYVILGLLLLILLILNAGQWGIAKAVNYQRTNQQCMTEERVFDYADELITRMAEPSMENNTFGDKNHYAGDLLRIYTDSNDTGNIDISINNEVNQYNDYKKPHYNNGYWQFNYFRNAIIIAATEKQLLRRLGVKDKSQLSPELIGTAQLVKCGYGCQEFHRTCRAHQLSFVVLVDAGISIHIPDHDPHLRCLKHLTFQEFADTYLHRFGPRQLQSIGSQGIHHRGVGHFRVVLRLHHFSFNHILSLHRHRRAACRLQALRSAHRADHHSAGHDRFGHRPGRKGHPGYPEE